MDGSAPPPPPTALALPEGFDVRLDGLSDTHAAIVTAALSLFAQYGYGKTNIGDIARACGMSPANLYRYFKNKQAIGFAVVDVFMAAEDARIKAAIAEAGPRAEARVRALIEASVMFTVEHVRKAPKLVELAEYMTETEQGLAVIQAHITERRALTAGLIADGVAAGAFAVSDPETAARALEMGTKFFLAPFAIARHGLDQVEDDLRVTLDLLIAGLRHG